MIPHKVYSQWTNFCQRFRWVIVAFWLTTAFFGLIFGSKLLERTTTDVSGPPDSNAAIADVQYVTHFPTTATGGLELTFFKTKTGQPITTGRIGDAMGKLFQDFTVSFTKY